MTSYYFKTFVKVNIILFTAFCLSACYVWELANYRWHNSKAKTSWSKSVGGEDVARMPFRKLNGHVLVDVKINNRPFTFVLDSGAAATVITETLATNLLDLPKDRTITISGQGRDGDRVAYVVHDITIELGSFSLQNISVIHVPTQSMPFDSIEETYFDGVLGADFFKCCLVEINNDEQLLYIAGLGATNKRHPTHNINEWEALDISVENDKPFLNTTAINNHSAKEIKLMIDTGSTGALTLFLNDDVFALPRVTYPAQTNGISGETDNSVGLLMQLDIGQFTFTDLPTYFRKEGANKQSSSHGILGNRVLMQFNVVLDFTNEKMWIKPTKHHSNQITNDRSGLRILPHSQGGIVKNVAKGLGGEAIGITPNSIITHISEERLTSDNFDRLMYKLMLPTYNTLPLCWQTQENNYCDVVELKSRF